jgi:ribosome maturation factor RimP
MTRQELADLVRPTLEIEGYELVECSVSRTPRSQTFRFAVDREGGVAIAACERASRLVAALLDANPILRGNYHLEVSSPGMNRPIWSGDHFRRFRDERVRIELSGPADGTRHLAGRIGPVDGEDVVILLDGGEERRVGLSTIHRANLQIDPWKKRTAPPGPGSAFAAESKVPGTEAPGEPE